MVRRWSDVREPPEDPTQRAADAQAREASALDPGGEERPTRTGRQGGQHPGRRSAATVRPRADKPRAGSWTGRARAPELAGGRGAPHPYRSPGPQIRGGGRPEAEFGSRQATGEGRGHRSGLTHTQTRAAVTGHTAGRD